MSLLLLALIIVAGLWIVIYAGAFVLQNWLYSVPASYLALRCLGCAAVVGGYLTFWCWVDSRNPGRYDTLINFSSYEIEDVDYVDAVKNVGGEEKLTRYTKYSTGSQVAWRSDNGQGFKRSDSEGPVIALLVPDKDKTARFTTPVDAKGNLPAGDIQYREEKGRRYIEGGANIGRVYRPGTMMVIWVLLINFAHFAVWALALWLILQFDTGHALALSCGLWLVVTLLLMPILFAKTRKPIRTTSTAPTPQVVAPAPQVNPSPGKQEPEPGVDEGQDK